MNFNPWNLSQNSEQKEQMSQGPSYNMQSGSKQNSYPTFPNQAGLGSQMAGQTPQNFSQSPFDMQSVSGIQVSPAPSMPGGGLLGAGTSNAFSDTSHGFNPWSLTGEAMTRG